MEMCYLIHLDVCVYILYIHTYIHLDVCVYILYIHTYIHLDVCIYILYIHTSGCQHTVYISVCQYIGI